MNMIDISTLTKLYYTIGEVAEMFDVSTSLIRYWEGEFSNLRPMKNRKGDRRFTKEQIQEVSLIYDLVKVQGYTLDGAKNALIEERHTSKRKKALLKQLMTLRKGLLGLRERL